jgi:hypothetical protein
MRHASLDALTPAEVEAALVDDLSAVGLLQAAPVR